MSVLLHNVQLTRLGVAPPAHLGALDLLVEDGRVAAVGPAGTLSARETIDGDGAVVLPGLRDRHVHLTQWAIARRRVDVSGAPSAAAAADLLARADRPAGGLLSGFGFRDGLWPDVPHRELLERALPGVPVAVVSQDLHSLWLSPAALALVGAADHPTGLLREEPAFRAVAALPQPELEVLDRWALEAVRAAAARGVTGILDFEFVDTAETWARRAAAGPGLPLRVDAAIFSELLDATISAGVRTGDLVAGTEGLVTVGPCKVLIDGSLNSRTAFCHDPYPGIIGDDARGLLTQDPDALSASISRAARHGIGYAVHAIGDRANTLALDCFEKAGVGGRIEHAQLVDAQDLPRFRRLGVIASVQPSHAVEDRDVADTHWADRIDKAFPYRALADAGATLEMGSDAPVSRLDPWHTIRSAVTRTDDDRPAWHPEQSLTVAEALAASTGGALHPAVGAPADLILVDRDPADLDPADLDDIQVLATLVAGRVVHRHP
jgi:predicted amidohydrolase YtcJ